MKGEVIKGSDIGVLNQFKKDISNFQPSQIFFLVTKWDLLEEKEKQGIKKKIKKKIQSVFDTDQINIHYTNLKEAEEILENQSTPEYEKLTNSFEKFIRSAFSIKLERFEPKLEQIFDCLIEFLKKIEEECVKDKNSEEEKKKKVKKSISEHSLKLSQGFEDFKKDIKRQFECIMQKIQEDMKKKSFLNR